MKKLNILITSLTIFILSATIVSASGCEIRTRDIYFENTCSVGPEIWYDFSWSTGGWYVCAIGTSTTDYNHPAYYFRVDNPNVSEQCYKPDDNVLWRYMAKNNWPTGNDIREGQICKVRWDLPLQPCGGQWEGKWDLEDNGCVQCNSQKKQIRKHNCIDGYVEEYIGSDLECEEACGASIKCDEKLSGAWCDGNIKKSCGSSCDYSEVDCKSYGSSYYCSYGVCKRSGGGVGCGLRGCLMMAIGPYILEIDPIPAISSISAILVIIEVIVVMTIFKKLHKTSKKKK